MQAVILAGGLGTRLRSIVSDKPKPMVDVAGRPFLEHQVEFLKRHRIGNFVLCVGHLHERIQEYFKDGSAWGVKIVYAIEEELLGTGGALKNAEKFLRDRFMVLNGDSFFDFDLAAFARAHEARQSANGGCVGSIALTQVHDRRNYGAITLGRDGRIMNFEEKSENTKTADYINAGVYVLESDILNHIPAARKTSLEHETFPCLLQAGKILFGHSGAGFFVDIGTPSGLDTFQRHMLERQAL